jgi:hypothetical protein
VEAIHEHHRPVRDRAAGQPEPGSEGRPSAHRRQAEVHRHQGEAGAHQQLGGRQGLRQAAGPQPQQPLEVEPHRDRGLRIELVALIDESCGLAGVGDRREGGEEGGETAAGSPPHELDQATAGEAAAEQPVERRHRGGHGLLAETAAQLARQVRRGPPSGSPVGRASRRLRARMRRIDRCGEVIMGCLRELASISSVGVKEA